MSEPDARFPVCSREEVRELDRRAIEEFGIPSCVLMENAGRASAFELMRWPEINQSECVLVCGPGNNGGDGLVIARCLLAHGVPVKVWMVASAERLKRSSVDVQLNLRLWNACGGTTQFLDQESLLAPFAEACGRAGLLVDALFGTGLQNVVRGLQRQVIEAMNGSGKPILAVDMPSGIDADSGEVLGAAVHARSTMTFVAQKKGQFLAQGPLHCGRLVSVEIGFQPSWLQGL